MNAVVLAGGVRSGLEVPGSGVPRALWPMPSESLISNVLHFLHAQNCDRIAICANGKTKMIASALSSGAKPWLDLHYSEDPLPRGPAGCLRDLHEWLSEAGTDEPFLAIQATAQYDFDLGAMLDEHKRTGAAITVGARTCAEDRTLLEPVGVYLVDSKTLSLIPPTGYQDFKEQFLPKVIAAGMTVRSHTIKGAATLIHSPNHYLSAIQDAIIRASEKLPAGYVERSPGVIVHETADIHPTVRLNAPVWIDANVIVEEHTVLAGPVIIGENSKIGGHSLLHRTVVMQNTTLPVASEIFSAILTPTTSRPTSSRRSLGGRQLPAETPSTETPSRNRTSRFFSIFATIRNID